MKVKHYLTKAQRKELEEQINHWHIQVMLTADNNFSIHKFEVMRDLYIDYVIWCGFKVTFDFHTDKYIITK